MLSLFYPDECADSAYVIDYRGLYEKGYRGVLFDIDNTLVEHGADASERAVELLAKLDDIGYKVCLLSNNKEERVKRFNQEIKVPYIFDAKKPSRKNYEKAMGVIGTNKRNTMFVGDQLFTDVFGAKRTGIKSFFVKPIAEREEIQIVLKRYLERVVLHSYRKDRFKNAK